MKNLLGLIFLLYISLAASQITFTREWVTGKRSPLPSKLITSADESLAISHHKLCKSIQPAIEYLIDFEMAKQRECGAHFNNKPFYHLDADLMKASKEEESGFEDRKHNL